MRSNVALRMSVRRSAGTEGLSPAISSLESTKASIGEWIQEASVTLGIAGFVSGWNAQCLFQASWRGSTNAELCGHWRLV